MSVMVGVVGLRGGYGDCCSSGRLKGLGMSWRTRRNLKEIQTEGQVNVEAWVLTKRSRSSPSWVMAMAMAVAPE